MALARTVLGLNAGFSILTGATLLVAGSALTGVMFAEPAHWQTLVFLALGIGLLIFAIDLVMLASDRFVTKGKVMAVIAADAGWVVGSAALLMFDRHLFTTTGAMIIAGVAALVAVFALGQWIGSRVIVAPLSSAAVTTSNGVLIATVKRQVQAPVQTVWRVMTDHPAYADVASNIAKVEVISGDGLGMERRCFGPKGENWTETCDLFEEGRAFGFTIHTDAPDYPYPLSDLQGRWSVEPAGSDRQNAQFEIHIRAVPKGGFLARLLFIAVAKRQFKTVLIDLADAWADRMESETRA